MTFFIIFSVLQVLSLLLICECFAMVPVANNEVMGPAEVGEPITRSVSDDLETINVQIVALGEIRNLQLVPRDGDVFAANLQIFVADVDDTGSPVVQPIPMSRTTEDDINSKLYTDITGSASLYVERRNGRLVLEGIIDHETRIENDAGHQERSLNEPVNHVVYKRVETDQGTCEAVVYNETDSEELIYAESRAIPSLVRPEVAVVFDYKTSLHHKFNLNEIRKYTGIFLNSINRRYASISSPRISNVITSIVITRSESAQNFLVYTKKPVLNARSTLDGFGRWIYKMKNSLKITSDIALWITAMGFAENIAGIAFVAGACRVSKNMNLNVGLVADVPGSYNGILTASHEMGHLFGSSHDAEKIDVPKGNPGALRCPSSGGYIMSYLFGSKNKFYFSSCSINQIRYTLNNPTFSCLLKSQKPSAVQPIGTLPGALKSLDDQCRVKHGSNYIFSVTKLSSVCTKMWCSPKPANGKVYSQGPALEGSRCGANKICVNGACVKK